MSQITVEKTAEDAASRLLKVTVPVDRVRAAEAKAVSYYSQRARLPGFRPGKAPEAVVRRRFTDAIRQTVLEEVLRESWETARTTEHLEPIGDFPWKGGGDGAAGLTQPDLFDHHSCAANVARK